MDLWFISSLDKSFIMPNSWSLFKGNYTLELIPSNESVAIKVIPSDIIFDHRMLGVFEFRET